MDRTENQTKKSFGWWISVKNSVRKGGDSRDTNISQASSLPPTAPPVVDFAWDCLDPTDYNIAVTGNAGAGKSSLVNSLRGLKASDSDASKTGISSTEQTLRSYKLNDSVAPAVRLWEIPGSLEEPGTSERYLQTGALSCILVVLSESLQETHLQAVRDAETAGVKVLFALAKADFIDANGEDLTEIRQKYEARMVEEKLQSTRVHLISNAKLMTLFRFLTSAPSGTRQQQLYDETELVARLLEFAKEDLLSENANVSGAKQLVDVVYKALTNLSGISNGIGTAETACVVPVSLL